MQTLLGDVEKTRENLMSTENERGCVLLFRAIAESVLEISDEEILEEMKEQGIDPEEVAKEVDSIFKKFIDKYKKASEK